MGGMREEVERLVLVWVTEQGMGGMREVVERLVVMTEQGMGGMRNEGGCVEAGGGDWTGNGRNEE
jgi:hypothetical protein